MRANYKLQRLFMENLPPQGAEFSPDSAQTHYLLHVLRLRIGQSLLLFDGKTGEWRAACAEAGKKTLRLRVEEQTRPQPKQKQKILYCFAPLKSARLDYMAQKAVEMGANLLQPVLTQHTQIRSVNYARLRSNCVEAAEQCGLLNIAEIAAPLPLEKLLRAWQPQWGRAARLFFCDEAQSAPADAEPTLAAAKPAADAVHRAVPQNPLFILQQLRKSSAKASGNTNATAAAAGSVGAQEVPPAIGLLIGPEGGFSALERALLYAQPHVTAIPLGPRILRADTAAVAALALLQATLGDW